MRPSTPSPPYLPPAERRAAPCRAAGGTSNLLPCPIVYSGNFTSVDIPCGAIPAVLRDTPQPAPSTGGSAVWFVSAGADVCAKFGSFAPFSDYWYLVQPVWLVYFFFNLALFVGCYVALRRWGHKHALSFLSLADIAGGATVCSAVTVSTFLFEYIIGSGFEKIYVAAEPVFWLMLVVLVTTAVFQVAYLNKAMQFYAISVVVPMHIVLFTLASIVGPSILYQAPRPPCPPPPPPPPPCRPTLPRPHTHAILRPSRAQPSSFPAPKPVAGAHARRE